MALQLKGLYKRFAYKPGMGGVEGDFRLSSLGSLAVATAELPKGELARAGVLFGAVVGNGATFKAPITAMPTTTATWALWNGEPDGGKSYLIDTAGCFLASGTAAVGMSLLGCVSNIRHAAQTAYASTVVSSLSGKGNPGPSLARLANAVTIAGGQPAWLVLAGQDNAASTTIGLGLVAQLKGGFLVPPGGLFCLDVLSGTGTTALYGVSLTWAELQLDLE